MFKKSKGAIWSHSGLLSEVICYHFPFGSVHSNHIVYVLFFRLAKLIPQVLCLYWSLCLSVISPGFHLFAFSLNRSFFFFLGSMSPRIFLKHSIQNFSHHFLDLPCFLSLSPLAFFYIKILATWNKGYFILSHCVLLSITHIYLFMNIKYMWEPNPYWVRFIWFWGGTT